MQVSMPSILTSKKFAAAAIATAISFFAIREDFTMEQIALITGPLYAYIGGQALADFGKEGVLISNNSTTTRDDITTTTISN